jgi:hypothetical protein
MQALRVETQVRQDGTILLNGLPWLPGEAVEVIVLPPSHPVVPGNGRPLAGLPLRYDRPFDPVVDPDDWEANR